MKVSVLTLAIVGLAVFMADSPRAAPIPREGMLIKRTGKCFGDCGGGSHYGSSTTPSSSTISSNPTPKTSEHCPHNTPVTPESTSSMSTKSSHHSAPHSVTHHHSSSSSPEWGHSSEASTPHSTKAHEAGHVPPGGQSYHKPDNLHPNDIRNRLPGKYQHPGHQKRGSHGDTSAGEIELHKRTSKCFGCGGEKEKGPPPISPAHSEEFGHTSQHPPPHPEKARVMGHEPPPTEHNYPHRPEGLPKKDIRNRLPPGYKHPQRKRGSSDAEPVSRDGELFKRSGNGKEKGPPPVSPANPFEFGHPSQHPKPHPQKARVMGHEPPPTGPKHQHRPEELHPNDIRNRLPKDYQHPPDKPGSSGNKRRSLKDSAEHVEGILGARADGAISTDIGKRSGTCSNCFGASCSKCFGKKEDAKSPSHFGSSNPPTPAPTRGGHVDTPFPQGKKTWEAGSQVKGAHHPDDIRNRLPPSYQHPDKGGSSSPPKQKRSGSCTGCFGRACGKCTGKEEDPKSPASSIGRAQSYREDIRDRLPPSRIQRPNTEQPHTQHPPDKNVISHGSSAYPGSSISKEGHQRRELVDEVEESLHARALTSCVGASCSAGRRPTGGARPHSPPRGFPTPASTFSKSSSFSSLPTKERPSMYGLPKPPGSSPAQLNMNYKPWEGRPSGLKKATPFVPSKARLGESSNAGSLPKRQPSAAEASPDPRKLNLAAKSWEGPRPSGLKQPSKAPLGKILSLPREVSSGQSSPDPRKINLAAKPWEGPRPAGLTQPSNKPERKERPMRLDQIKPDLDVLGH